MRTRCTLLWGASGVKTAKRGRLASIPVTPRMGQIIDAAPSDGPILRNASGDPWTTSYLSQTIKRYARKAKLDERLHLHDARGTACTRLLMAGATLGEIEAALDSPDQTRSLSLATS